MGITVVIEKTHEFSLNDSLPCSFHLMILTDVTLFLYPCFKTSVRNEGRMLNFCKYLDEKINPDLFSVENLSREEMSLLQTYAITS